MVSRLLLGLNSLPSPDVPVHSFTSLLSYVLSNMGLELPFSSDPSRTEHAVFLIKVSRYCCSTTTKELCFIFCPLVDLSLKNLKSQKRLTASRHLVLQQKSLPISSFFSLIASN